MRRDLQLSLAVLALFVAGCSEPERCIRESHCMSGFVCVSGHCVMPEAGMDDSGPMRDATVDATMDAEAGSSDASADADATPMVDGGDGGPPMDAAADGGDSSMSLPDGGTSDAMGM